MKIPCQKFKCKEKEPKRKKERKEKAASNGPHQKVIYKHENGQVLFWEVSSPGSKAWKLHNI